ncbi:MAG: alpha/beta fold hydrolase [Candidatus Dojkabacteria bacterium]
MPLDFDYRKHTTIYKGYSIQTYQFGEGENVVFSFPSFPHSGLYYLWFLTHYNTSKVKFITFDLPGWTGYSENIFQTNKFTLDEYVEIAKVILKDYKIERFSVIGYSFGGALALKLAADMKSKVDKVVLVSSVINSRIIRGFRVVNLVKLLHITKYYYILKALIKGRFKAIAKILNREEGMPKVFIDMYTDMLNHIDSKIISDSIYQLFTSDYSKYIPEINEKNVLVVNSRDEGRMFTVQAEYMRRHLNNEKSLYIHGTHDDFILKCKKDVVRDVVTFLTT